MSESDPAGDTSYYLRRVLLGVLSLILLIICIGFTYVIPLINPLQGVDRPLISESYIPPTLENTATVRIERSMTATDSVTITATFTPVSQNIRDIAKVIRVIDGDTIEVMLNGELKAVRYIGIDSPEPGEWLSDLAAKTNRELVGGEVVELERDVSDTDQYGRLLRYVYLSNGTMVNAHLVELGFALAVAYPPDVKHRDLMTRKQEYAKGKGLGLWAPFTPTPPEGIPVSQVVIDPTCSQFNAPGNDNENLNEEYVCLVNPGEESIDISGWSITDEYGWVYTFEKYVLEARSTTKLRSGCGKNTQVDLFWCRSETAVWNNDGDCVYLRDAAGEARGEYCY